MIKFDKNNYHYIKNNFTYLKFLLFEYNNYLDHN